MKTTKKISALLICLSFAAACTYEFPPVEEAPTQGEADFTRMISVGNSLTAGLMNGAVYTQSQNNSFVNILATQMQLVGGGTFNQATINSENGCYNPAGGCTQGRLYLKIGPAGPSPTPKPGHGDASLFAPLSTEAKAALNNFGVPGVTITAARNSALSANPYYGKIASDPGTSTLIGDAAAALNDGGTFFTFWLGNNDVLGYATSGGATAAPIDGPTFKSFYDPAIADMLAGNDAKGAVANIPDVTSIPYFSTVAWNVVKLSSEAQADALNGAYAGYNAGVAGSPLSAEEKARRTISFRYKTVLPADPGYATAPIMSNPLVITDEYLTDLSGGGLPSYRQTTSDDLITLTAGAVIAGAGGGTSAPLGDQYVLVPQEKTIAQDAVAAYNAVISAAVTANSDRLVLVNANAALLRIRNTSVTINGSALTASITPPNGAFSLDGVHPNARGSAYIANEFITAINAKFGSNIPLTNPNSFPGNELPVP